MLRSSLKAVEGGFADKGLIRCHRKYIVNTGKIKLVRHNGQGYEVVLSHDAIPALPVSKTYEPQIKGFFS